VVLACVALELEDLAHLDQPEEVLNQWPKLIATPTVSRKIDPKEALDLPEVERLW